MRSRGERIGAAVQDERSRGLPMTLRRVLYTASLCGALLAPPSAMPAHASEAGAHASIASTSRWWKLDCGKTSRKREAGTTACAFTVKLRGVIDGSRLQLVRHALQRRDTVRHALHREVDFHVDVDSQGGELFATLEIGRIMRAEGASISVGPGAACISACVFLLMGAIERTISGDARVGIHRPSLQAPQEGGPRQASEDEIVAAMFEQLVLYAQQMNVPRTIIDALMLVPPDRVELLSASELATYGINALDAVALEERRAHSQFLPR
jgi:ATP-dependent protease ClpP protease subunit